VQFSFLVIKEPHGKADTQSGESKPEDDPGVTAEKQRDLSPTFVLNCCRRLQVIHLVKKGLEV